MKRFNAILAALALMALVPLAANANNMKPYEQMVDNISAVQAMAYANQWKWTQPGIKTSVTPIEVVFEFPGKTIKKVALPPDKMVVAIAPYLTYTHG